MSLASPQALTGHVPPSVGHMVELNVFLGVSDLGTRVSETKAWEGTPSRDWLGVNYKPATVPSGAGGRGLYTRPCSQAASQMGWVSTDGMGVH